ncbi:hypothetical protein IM40_05785 [Candidatus Paracaedimonas acanthamoebae]|nr:hypothetical protein IM40_05785 [Candidatus Paracaedimonas acanthamoebae]
MNKSVFLFSLSVTTALLRMPAIATSYLEEVEKNNRPGLPKDSSSQDTPVAIKKAQIKASEDIGAFLGACIPQMRTLKEWVGGFLDDKQSQPTESMITSPRAEDYDTTIKIFTNNATVNVDQLIKDGIGLMESNANSLLNNKMGDISAYSMLGDLLARIYAIELLLAEHFSPYMPHHKELKGYHTFWQTRQKEKEGLQKLQQQIQNSQQETTPSSNERSSILVALTCELEQKFRTVEENAQKLRRLTIALSHGEALDFSSFVEEQSPTSALLSPRNNSSSPQKTLYTESSSPSSESSQTNTSTQRGRGASIVSSPISLKSKKTLALGGSSPSLQSPEKTQLTSDDDDRVVRRKRATSSGTSSYASHISSSSSSSPTASESKSKKLGRSGSVSIASSAQGVSHSDLQESPLFRGLSTKPSPSEKPAELSGSPKEGSPTSSKKEKGGVLVSFKRVLSGKSGKKSPFQEDSSSETSSSTSSSPKNSSKFLPQEKK